MAELVVASIISKLAYTVVQKALLLYGVHDKVAWLHREFSSIEVFLKDVDTMHHKDERLKHWENEVQDVAYLMVGVLEKYSAEVGGGRREGPRNILKRIDKKFMKLIARRKIGNEIDQIQQRLHEISESRIRYGIGQASSGAFVELPFIDPDIDETKVVGFEVESETIVEQLIDANITRRSVISIVGVGGSGKTILANKVYKSAEVKCHFGISMWLTISQDYKLIDILKKMFYKITEEVTSEWWNNGEDYFITKLKKSMRERKYLVVLDDVRSSDVWTQLEDAFPNANNGSRVLVTTRFIEIAEELDILSKPHVMQPFNEEESKQLLLKKIFPNQFANEFPSDLLPLATQFTKKCDGFPLALVVVGSILSRKNLDYITWAKVMPPKDWHTDGRSYLDVISTSYENLPATLKLCFMYFSVFPEDYQIKATTLIQLWIAEGFIQQDGVKLLEDIAESYLKELVQRCMVQVSTRSCIGKIKYCHIHDLLRYLAIQKAKENNFLIAVPENGTKLSSRTSSRCVALHVYDDMMIEQASRYLRSLISFVHVPNVNKFRALQVLHISAEPYEYLPGTNYWTALKYFGFECSLYSYCQLPTSRSTKSSHLTYLNNVQTVRTLFCIVHDELPPSFWYNKQLRHIKITCCFFCEAAPEGPPSAADLQSLLTLKGVRARKEWVSQLPNFPNIRKLGIVIPENVAGEPLINLLSKLNNLGSLYLEMSGNNLMTFPGCISSFVNHNSLHSLNLVWGRWPRKEVVDCNLFPPNLVKLTLVHFSFEEDPMPQLEKLPKLRVLKLQCGGNIEAADGEVQMICSRGGFGCLQQLVLSVKHLEEWKIEKGAMPMLNQLVLKRCRKLQIVPDLQYLVKLVEFTADGCSDQFNTRLQGEDQCKIKHIPSVTMLKGLYK